MKKPVKPKRERIFLPLNVAVELPQANVQRSHFQVWEADYSCFIPAKNDTKAVNTLVESHELAKKLVVKAGGSVEDLSIAAFCEHPQYDHYYDVNIEEVLSITLKWVYDGLESTEAFEKRLAKYEEDLQQYEAYQQIPAAEKKKLAQERKRLKEIEALEKRLNELRTTN